MIGFVIRDIDFRLCDRRRLSAWLRAAAREEGRGVGELAVVFTSSAGLLEINRQYLGHDYHTDIITFDYRDPLKPGQISGDLMIDVETVAANAARFGMTFEVELRRVMVHGVLHLCGYKDKSRAEQATMREREEHYLSLYDGV